MQFGLRHVARNVPSTGYSRLETRRYASFINPLDWVKEKLAPGLKEKPKQEEVDAGRKQAAQEGNRNIFEEAVSPPPPPVEGPSTPSTVLPSKAPSKVDRRPVRDLSHAWEPHPRQHKYSTANFKISHRKLNMIGQQISGKPIDAAILQMQFSEKRASTRIMNMLATARDHAVRYKKLNESKLIVAEAWVSKGPKGAKRLEPRGRGHTGIQTHPNSKLTVILKEGKTEQEKRIDEFKKKMRKINSPYVREDKPIRNPSPTWGW